LKVLEKSLNFNIKR